MADRKRNDLTVAEWLASMRDIAMHCPAQPGSRAAARVRELHDLIVSAPRPEMIEGLRALDVNRLEALLDAGAADAAALALFGEGGSYLLSRSGDGLVLASVSLPGTLCEKSAAGHTPALAIVGALARALANAAAVARAANRMVDVPAPPPRLQLVAALH